MEAYQTIPGFVVVMENVLDYTSVNATRDIMEALVRLVHALEYFLTAVVYVLEMGIVIERNAIVIEVILEKIVPKQQRVEERFRPVMYVQEEVIVLQKILVFVLIITQDPIVNILCVMELALQIQMFALDRVHVLA